MKIASPLQPSHNILVVTIFNIQVHCSNQIQILCSTGSTKIIFCNTRSLLQKKKRIENLWLAVKWIFTSTCTGITQHDTLCTHLIYKIHFFVFSTSYWWRDPHFKLLCKDPSLKCYIHPINTSTVGMCSNPAMPQKCILLEYTTWLKNKSYLYSIYVQSYMIGKLTNNIRSDISMFFSNAVEKPFKKWTGRWSNIM